MRWQLVEESQINATLEATKLVVCPVELEEAYYIVALSIVYPFASIEDLDHAKE